MNNSNKSNEVAEETLKIADSRNEKTQPKAGF